MYCSKLQCLERLPHWQQMGGLGSGEAECMMEINCNLFETTGKAVQLSRRDRDRAIRATKCGQRQRQLSLPPPLRYPIIIFLAPAGAQRKHHRKSTIAGFWPSLGPLSAPWHSATSPDCGSPGQNCSLHVSPMSRQGWCAIWWCSFGMAGSINAVRPQPQIRMLFEAEGPHDAALHRAKNWPFNGRLLVDLCHDCPYKLACKPCVLNHEPFGSNIADLVSWSGCLAYTNPSSPKAATFSDTHWSPWYCFPTLLPPLAPRPSLLDEGFSTGGGCAQSASQ